VGVVGAEADQAAAELAALQQRVRALGERVRHDVIAAFGDMQGARKQVDVATDGYRTGRAWVALAYERFELGTASAKDLVDGLAGFVKARYTYLQTTLDYNLTVARLSAAVGEELQPELASPAH
jgi:outer membrane protein TolC